MWTRPRAKADAAAPPDDGTLLSAYEAARTARGYPRTVTTLLSKGDRVFVSGVVTREDGALLVQAGTEGDLIVAAEDPGAFATRHALVAIAFIVLELAACALATRVATWPPVFGRTSTVGGLMCIAFFLGVTPAGVAVRDACRLPSEARLRGLWVAKPR